MTAAGGTITMLVGAVLLRLTITDDYERYVRVGMGKWLLVAGVAVILLGLVTVVQSLRRVVPVDAHGHHDHDHDDEGHDHGIGVGWLLLAPIAALLLVAPPTLGSYGVNRSASVDVRAGAPVFHRLAPRRAPLPMSLLEFSQRAYDHNGASFRRVPVTLTGFVSKVEDGGFQLARYTIACCAADASPVVVVVRGTTGPPPLDEWIEVTGTFLRAGEQLPELGATSVAGVPAPVDPYE